MQLLSLNIGLQRTRLIEDLLAENGESQLVDSEEDVGDVDDV